MNWLERILTYAVEYWAGLWFILALPYLLKLIGLIFGRKQRPLI